MMQDWQCIISITKNVYGMKFEIQHPTRKGNFVYENTEMSMKGETLKKLEHPRCRPIHQLEVQLLYQLQMCSSCLPQTASQDQILWP